MPPSCCHLLLPSLTLVTLIVVEFHITVFVLHVWCRASEVSSGHGGYLYIVTVDVYQNLAWLPAFHPSSIVWPTKMHFLWLMAWLPPARQPCRQCEIGREKTCCICTNNALGSC